jgi:SAM-dependent methyltransferase
MDGMRATWDAAAALASDLVIGDPVRAPEEVGYLFGRVGLELRADAVCVEVGCGPARMTVELASRFREVVGVDVSPLMLVRAAHKIAREQIENVRFQLVSGQRLDGIADGSADVIVSYEQLQHLPSRALVEAYFAEFVRVLAPGGQAVIQIPVLDPGVRPRIWRAVRAMIVPVLSLASRSLFASRSYRGTRLTRAQLERALARAGAEITSLEPGRTWRVGGSKFTNCTELFVRFGRAPARVLQPVGTPRPAEAVAA